MPSNILNVVPHGVYLVQYNGYTWDPAVTRTESIRSVPEWDAARRTIKFMRTTIQLSWHVFLPPPTTIDATMDALKQRLESPGGAFYYREKGFGDFNINVPGGQKKDVAWGPHPGEFTAKPTADAYCWECNWSIEVCIPWCDAAKFENAVVEWNYQWYCDKDNGGYETRRIVGHIEIAMTRTAQGDRLVRASADDYREDITPRCPPFFRPTVRYFNLSEDRRRLTFNFSFEQMPGPVPPPGILEVKMSDSMSNAVNLNMCSWNWTLQADYELVFGVPHALAALEFFKAYFQIRKAIRKEIFDNKWFDPNNKKNDGGGKKKGPGEQAGEIIGGIGGIYQGPGGVIIGADIGGRIGKEFDGSDPSPTPDYEKIGIAVIPASFTATNPDRYGKPKCSFSLTSLISGLQSVCLTAGLWTKLEGDSNYDLWYQKAEKVFGPRGINGHRFDPSDDVIIDLCRKTIISKLKTPALAKITIEIPTPFGPLQTEVDEDSTWLVYKNHLELLQEDSVLVHKPLPQDRTLRSRRGGDARLVSGGSLSSGIMGKYIPPEDQSNGGFQYGTGNGSQSISTIARQSASTFTIVMSGHACRLALLPSPPRLFSIGGVPAVSANDPDKGDGFRYTTIGNVGVPIYVTHWQFRYLLPCAPGTKSQDPDTGTPITLPSTGGKATFRTLPNFGGQAKLQTLPFTGDASQWGMRRY